MVQAAADSTGNILDRYSGGFQELMPHRVEHVVLVSSLYESFILEEEGLLSELITNAAWCSNPLGLPPTLPPHQNPNTTGGTRRGPPWVRNNKEPSK